MTRWFVRRSDDGEVLLVARVRDEGGLHPEVWAAGAWAAFPAAMEYFFNPLAADEVNQRAAEAAIGQL